MARKKVNPEEELARAAAVEEPVSQDTPLAEEGMPPGEDRPTVTEEETPADGASIGSDPVESTAEKSEDGADLAENGVLPERIELPPESELPPDEVPLPVEMRETPREPDPSEQYAADSLEKADAPARIPTAEESDWGFQEEQKAGEPAPDPPVAPAPSKSDRQRFYELKFNEVDRHLTPEERQEWNTIYASYRGRSSITGTIIGVDPLSIYVWNPETEQREKKTMYCAIVVPYRVRIVVPASEMWEEGGARPDYVLQNMVGATIDFIIIKVEREAGFAIGSRRLAGRSQRYFFAHREDLHRIGARVKCRMLAVGPRRCLVDCYGHDLDITQREMRYASIPDLRNEYHPGMEIDCIVKVFDPDKDALEISIKETEVNPFFGAEQRHPVGSRRLAVISGKYGGGVFCNLPDGVVCMCNYSYQHEDADFMVGENVMLIVQRYEDEKLQMYGKIMSKW